MKTKAVESVIETEIAAIAKMITITTMKMIHATEDLTNAIVRKIHVIVTKMILVIVLMIMNAIAINAMMTNAIVINVMITVIIVMNVIMIDAIMTNVIAIDAIVTAATVSIKLMIAKPIVVTGFLIHGDAVVKFLCHHYHQNQMIVAATETVVDAVTIVIMIQVYSIYTTVKQLLWHMFQEFSSIQRKISTI